MPWTKTHRTYIHVFINDVWILLGYSLRPIYISLYWWLKIRAFRLKHEWENAHQSKMKPSPLLLISVGTYFAGMFIKRKEFRLNLVRRMIPQCRLLFGELLKYLHRVEFLISTSIYYILLFHLPIAFYKLLHTLYIRYFVLGHSFDNFVVVRTVGNRWR